jgi:hypothetical protein
MEKLVTFVSIDSEPSPRLVAAQIRLKRSLRQFNLTALPYSGGKKLVLLGDVLEAARRVCNDSAFFWCNTDVTVTRDPCDLLDCGKVFGFRRREVPSGNIAGGVDAYYIPTFLWDRYLASDVPKLYVGASYVDWWISRAMEKAGLYENLIGYIDHESHPRSTASGSEADPYYQHNFRAYNAWARRNGLAPIPAPRFLVPKLGHVWGVRDAWAKMNAKFRSRGSVSG